MRKGPHWLQETPSTQALWENRLLGPLGGRAEQGLRVSHLGLLLPPAYTCWIRAVMDIGDNHHECELGNILGWHMVNTYG